MARKQAKITKAQRRKAERLKQERGTAWHPSAAQIRTFESAARNYNRRRQTVIEKWKDRIDDDDPAGVLARAQVIGAKWTTRIESIESAEEYNAALRIMRQDKTKGYQTQRRRRMQDVMEKAVLEGFAFNNKSKEWKEANRIIKGMSTEEITAFRLDYPKMIQDMFHRYSGEGGILNADALADERQTLLLRLREYDKKLDASQRRQARELAQMTLD